MALLALAMACLSYYWVELPMLRKREKKVQESGTAPPVIADVSASAA